eukprot:TRINITY_DN13916_c0_g1_i2.p1 TRINITY_DN13916_c0_g1~~TRINITY_DN13916_c0_g1_i2.p1  ORF type:complete len:171 (+),score=21.61 TRINITY_DN13916_c0_g1_i2:358-870(+)
MTSMALNRKNQMEVHLYIKGQGPKHQFKAELMGWEQPNRLDLAGIKKTYKVKTLYAFSVYTGRGLPLYPNPRNGLSMTTYSGKEDTVVRLDADPAPPVLWSLLSPFAPLAALAFAIIVAAGFFSMDTQRSARLTKFARDGPEWPFILVIFLLLALYAWRAWRATLFRWYK